MMILKKILKVTLTINNKTFANCNYLQMDHFAPTTARKFTFYSIRTKEDIEIKSGDKLKIRIYNTRKYDSKTCIYDFEILILDTKIESKKIMWVYGLVHNDYDEEYKQGVIDIFNIWQLNKEFNWFNLPINSYQKSDYLTACFHYTSVSIKIIEKRVYQIDMSIVKEEQDFLYLVSLEFLGERGYFGHNFYTFADCLLILYRALGYFENKKILFKGTSKIDSPPVFNLLNDIKKEFIKYKFSVEEER